MKTLLFYFMVLTAFVSIEAQVKLPSIGTDRPDFTESPVTIFKGYYQIETGFLFTSEKFDSEIPSRETSKLGILGTLLRVGLNDWFELRLGGEFDFFTEKIGAAEFTESGIGALLVGGKAQFMSSENSFADMGILCEILLPFGADAFKPAKAEPRIYLAVNHNLPSNFFFAYNYGVQYKSTTEDFFHFYSLSVSKILNQEFSAYLENYGFIQSGVDPRMFLDIGLLYLINNKTQLDLYVGKELSKNSNSFFIGAGFAIRLPN